MDATIVSNGVQYKYDNMGRRTQAIDANGNATLYYYDLESRLTYTVIAGNAATR